MSIFTSATFQCMEVSICKEAIKMKIKYEFVTGETVEIEVPDEIAEVCIQIDQEAKRQNRKETRRHISLSLLKEEQAKDLDIVVTTVEEKIIKQIIKNTLKRLLPEQQELIFKVFFCEKSISEIAKEEGVTKSAICSRLNTIYRKLKEIDF